VERLDTELYRSMLGRRTIVLQISIYRADGKLAAMMIDRNRPAEAQRGEVSVEQLCGTSAPRGHLKSG
jgi:hypothetical protein